MLHDAPWSRPLRPTSLFFPPPLKRQKKEKRKRNAAPFLFGPSPAPPWPCFFFCRPPSLVFFFFFSLFFLFLSSSSRCYLYFVLHLFSSFPLRCDTPELSFSSRKKFSLFSFLLKIPPALFWKDTLFISKLNSFPVLRFFNHPFFFLISLYNVL